MTIIKNYTYPKPLSKIQINESIKRLKEFDSIDEKTVKTIERRNYLESLLFENKELLKQFIDTEFRKLTGRVYISKSNDRRLIIAVNGSDIELKEYFTDSYDKGKHLRETYFSSTNFEKVEFNELILT